MKKLCFVVDDEPTAQDVLDDLRKVGLTDENFHVLAKDKKALESLPDAALIEEKDIVGGVVRSGIAGSTTGLVAGLVVATFPAAGLVAAGSAALIGALGGGSFGMWVGVMIGSSVPNSQLDEWQEFIDQGRFLIIVGTDEDKEAAVIEKLNSLNLTISAFSEKGTIPVI